ncbi:unnamed protein product [Arctia plantaginis]|uniref:Phosphatidylinositol N-acetylglucosaminyltransferase subunit Q n=1 Tax=Arctia plantaginis TaxID=874455 RepID=A0A8S0YWN7_ARCPL|nr:unnamed protein product [Arctia plantaginis]
MNSVVRILLPLFSGNAKEIFFKGYISVEDNHIITIYVTKFGETNELLMAKEKDIEHTLYGYMGHNMHKKLTHKFQNFLVIEQNSTFHIKGLIINGKQFRNTNNCITVLYDYDNIKDSQAICISKNDYLAKLIDLIQDKHEDFFAKNCKKESYSSPWYGSSMLLQHVFNYWRLIEWLISTLKRDKKVSIKQGNLILAILMDLALGYIALQLLPKNKVDISSALMGVLERLINLLYSLLKWLMGAPVGLKLNNAFNKMLGKYFLYHVQLWWLFLDVSGERLDIILHIYNYIGYLGFTFQTAIVSDLICIATFHSYCIYVYAARLFNIQISGLIALLRLFVGRKYNPLRGGIDSCEYTNQELFVGTVAFTILLLLLPTTALYYIVFTAFRVLSLVIQYALSKLIYIVQTSPLFVVFLRLTHSSKVKGNILMEVVNEEENTPLVLRIKLFYKSIPELVNLFKPPVDVPKQVEWTDLLSNVLVGKQIV